MAKPNVVVDKDKDCAALVLLRPLWPEAFRTRTARHDKHGTRKLNDGKAAEILEIDEVAGNAERTERDWESVDSA